MSASRVTKLCSSLLIRRGQRDDCQCSVRASPIATDKVKRPKAVKPPARATSQVTACHTLIIYPLSSPRLAWLPWARSLQPAGRSKEIVVPIARNCEQAMPNEPCMEPGDIRAGYRCLRAIVVSKASSLLLLEETAACRG